MDISSRGFCFRTITILKESPVGIYVIPLIEEYSKTTKSHITFQLITEKLDKNKYSSIPEWYEEIKLMLDETAKSAASQTDFGLMCQTLLQMVEEQIIINNVPIICGMYGKRNMQKIVNRFENAMELVPNSKNKFLKTLEELPPATPHPFTPNKDKYPKFGPDEIVDLYNELLRLGTDEEVQSVYRIANTFENFQVKKKKKTIVRFNLQEMSPFTLSLIKKHIKNGLNT